MSQTKKPRLSIRTRGPGISTGANTVVLLDGVEIPYISFLKLEFKPKKVTKIVMEILADVDVQLDEATVLQHVLSKYHKV